GRRLPRDRPRPRGPDAPPRTSRSGTRACRCRTRSERTTRRWACAPGCHPPRRRGKSRTVASAESAIIPARMIAARSAPATPPAPFSAFGGQTPGRPAGTSDAARTRAGDWAALSSRLAARRAAGMGLRLWLVCAALALCASAFTYWQVRVPLDGIARHAGGAVAAGRLGLVLAAFVLAAGAIAASRQVTLASAPPGPEWLALPVEPALVERHLAREARLPALPLVAPATAAWLAGRGPLPLA